MKILLSLILFFSQWLVGQTLPARYHTYQQVLDTLIILQNSFPHILHLDTMGYSTRDSIPILFVKISDNPEADEDEPSVFILGGVHANEVLGPEIVLGFISDITKRYQQGDPQITYYINSLETFAVPFTNPEGHIVVENGNTDWRKNKCDNDSNGVFDFHDGVDNNRNYDLGWEIDSDDSCTVPEYVMYKGTAPFSQNENTAVRNLAWKYRPLFCIDYHSPDYGLGEVAYYSWYWSFSLGGHGYSPDEVMMADICRQYCSKIINDAGDSTYEARRGLVNKGDLKSYMYGNFGTAAFTVEVSDTTIQNPAMVDGIVERNIPGIYFLFERASGPGITGMIRDSVTNEPLEAEVQVLEAINEDIKPRLSRPEHGRYNRMLSAGSYTLKFLKEGYLEKTVSVSVNKYYPTVTDINLVPFPLVNTDNQLKNPDKLVLQQNYPNPFNSGSVIRYSVPFQAKVQIKVYDILGREVRTLLDEVNSAGEHSIYINSDGLSGGVYIYRLVTNGSISAKKMTILK